MFTLYAYKFSLSGALILVLIYEVAAQEKDPQLYFVIQTRVAKQRSRQHLQGMRGNC